MKLLLRTSNKKEADTCQLKSTLKYSGMAIYRIQYRTNDGKFYYEILLNELWIDDNVKDK